MKKIFLSTILYLITSICFASSEVGQIHIEQGVSPSGAKTCTVPIKAYSGEECAVPSISLTYNSQQGNGIVGIGWNLSGIPMITRAGKNIYFDNTTDAVRMDLSDSFYLDGSRLIKKKQEGNLIYYEPEQGNGKIVAHISNNVINYFEVYFANGCHGVFGFEDNSSQQLFYPLTKYTDLKDRNIYYEYYYANNHYDIKRISYGDATIFFVYTNRPDKISAYRAGLSLEEGRRLTNIECSFDGGFLWQYQLTYDLVNSYSALTKIDFLAAGGDEMTPLRFEYGGSGNIFVYSSYSVETNDGPNQSNRNDISAIRGRFDSSSDSDGCVIYPNKNPYSYTYTRNEFNKGQLPLLKNPYNENDPVYINTTITDSTNNSHKINTGKGFVKALAADIDGTFEDAFIKINNIPQNGKDHVIFDIYKNVPTKGLEKAYSRSFDFNTLFTQPNSTIQEIQPKFYYSGDFNGDGKAEILAVSARGFRGDNRQSMCYLFDLTDNKILYQGHLFNYRAFEFCGIYPDGSKDYIRTATNIVTLDFDGDRKTDLCIVDSTSTNLFSFDESSNVISARQVGSYAEIKNTDLDLNKRELFAGDFNGDGLADLLLSPNGFDKNDKTWILHLSKGNGEFQKFNISGPRKFKERTYFTMDIDGDGCSDLIEYDDTSLHSYVFRSDKLIDAGVIILHDNKSLLIPLDINTPNKYSRTNLIGIKGKTRTLYKYNQDFQNTLLLYKTTNSMGVENCNSYYSFGHTGHDNIFPQKLQYPYVNFKMPARCLSSTKTISNGTLVDVNDYTYEQPVFHRQGRGFCGFAKMLIKDREGHYVESNYAPQNYGVLESQSSLAHHYAYKYSIDVDNNKHAKILLTSKEETDSLHNITINGTYIYDKYGNLLSQTEEYSGDSDIEIEKMFTYDNSENLSNYHIGALTEQTVTMTRNGESSEEMVEAQLNSKLLPTTISKYKNGLSVETVSFEYDAKNNVVAKHVVPYDADYTKTSTYSYDSKNRLVKSTDEFNQETELTYDDYGRIASKKDHNGNIFSYQYDRFGRNVLITRPDNSEVQTTYLWGNQPNEKFQIKIEETGKPTTITSYDAFGREVRNSRIAFNGKTVSVDKVYDAYGNLIKESLPYYDSPSYWNEYSYDKHNRMTTCKDASGKTTSYSYWQNTITSADEKQQKRREYDPLGNLISVTDETGSIKYTLNSDNNPTEIKLADNVKTIFEYDEYGRLIQRTDPSYGTSTYTYTDAGNLAKSINANGKAITYNYDNKGRLIKKTMPEFSTSYTYDEKNRLVETKSSNNSSRKYTYDNLGRVASIMEYAQKAFAEQRPINPRVSDVVTNGMDLSAGKNPYRPIADSLRIIDGPQREFRNVWLEQEFSYNKNNVSNIKYSSSSGVLADVSYSYENGYLTEQVLNGTETIWKLRDENEFGSPTNYKTGILAKNDCYSQLGFPTTNNVLKSGSPLMYQILSYKIDPTTRLLTKRINVRKNITETFEYDNQDRLVTFNGEHVDYDALGNIVCKSDVGSFEYSSDKPYAVSSITDLVADVPAISQTVEYTSFERPKKITDKDYSVTFVYNDDFDRVKMSQKIGKSYSEKFYIGNCYEDEDGIERLYLGGDYYHAPVVLVRKNKVDSLYNIVRDKLGSVRMIISSTGDVIEDNEFDPWGRRINPATRKPYEFGEDPRLFLGRGFTGHEHLIGAGLINMNARLYDPITCRFLSPDPYIQLSDNRQSYNRYSYCLNNPLKYTDISGENPWVILAAIAGAYLGGVATNKGELNPLRWDYSEPMTYLGMGICALSGGIAGSVISGSTAWCISSSISSKIISAGVTVSPTVASGVRYGFHWTTAGGGGGDITNYGTPDANVYNSINKARKEEYDYRQWFRDYDNMLDNINNSFDLPASSLYENAGESTVGSNWKYYWHAAGERGFYGNQYVSTKSLSKVGESITKVTGPIGKVLGAISIGVGVYDDYSNYRDTGNTNAYNTIRAFADFGGGLAGAALGVKIGGVIGSGFGGVGAIPGAVIGGVLFGVACSFGGSWIGTTTVDYIYGY